MHKVNIIKLKQQLPIYLDQAHAGDEVWIVSKSGKVIARLLPPVDEQVDVLAQLKQLRERCVVGDVISPIDENWNSANKL